MAAEEEAEEAAAAAEAEAEAGLEAMDVGDASLDGDDDASAPDGVPGGDGIDDLLDMLDDDPAEPDRLGPGGGDVEEGANSGYVPGGDGIDDLLDMLDDDEDPGATVDDTAEDDEEDSM